MKGVVLIVFGAIVQNRCVGSVTTQHMIHHTKQKEIFLLPQRELMSSGLDMKRARSKSLISTDRRALCPEEGNDEQKGQVFFSG
jgi:hypothetical protein